MGRAGVSLSERTGLFLPLHLPNCEFALVNLTNQSLGHLSHKMRGLDLTWRGLHREEGSEAVPACLAPGGTRKEPLLSAPSDSISKFILMDPHCPHFPGLMGSCLDHPQVLALHPCFPSGSQIPFPQHPCGPTASAPSPSPALSPGGFLMFPEDKGAGLPHPLPSAPSSAHPGFPPRFFHTRPPLLHPGSGAVAPTVHVQCCPPGLPCLDPPDCSHV